MNLSHDYRLITSALDTPVDFHRELGESFYPGSGHFDAAFWVGNFEYSVIFNAIHPEGDYWENPESPTHSNNYTLLFKISDSRFSSDEEMVRVISQIAKRPLSLKQAQYYLKDFDKYGLTNLGESRPILSGVIRVFRDFIHQYSPSCIVFDAFEPKRRRLYQSLSKSLQRQLNLTYTTRMKNESQEFTLCLKPTG